MIGNMFATSGKLLGMILGIQLVMALVKAFPEIVRGIVTTAPGLVRIFFDKIRGFIWRRTAEEEPEAESNETDVEPEQKVRHRRTERHSNGAA